MTRRWWHIGRPDPAPRSAALIYAAMVAVACLITILGAVAAVDWIRP